MLSPRPFRCCFNFAATLQVKPVEAGRISTLWGLQPGEEHGRCEQCPSQPRGCLGGRGAYRFGILGIVRRVREVLVDTDLCNDGRALGRAGPDRQTTVCTTTVSVYTIHTNTGKHPIPIITTRCFRLNCRKRSGQNIRHGQHHTQGEDAKESPLNHHSYKLPLAIPIHYSSSSFYRNTIYSFCRSKRFDRSRRKNYSKARALTKRRRF